MKRTIITITASLLVVMVAKEIASFARSNWNLESYLLGKQVDRNERETDKTRRQHMRDAGSKLAGHNVTAGDSRYKLAGHNMMSSDPTNDSLNYHQAVSN